MTAVSYGWIAIASLAASGASASVQTIGGTLAKSCFEAAEAKLATANALSDCDRAMAEEALTWENRVATFVNRGIVRLFRNDLVNAERDFDSALAMNPNQAEAWLNKGVVRYRLGDSRGASAMFSRAIELKVPDQALAYYARGIAHEDQGKVSAAYADLRQAQALRPDWELPGIELRRYQVRRN